MLIDTHCHIPHKNYPKSTEEIITAAHNEGIERLITIGTNLKDNITVIKTAEKFNNVFAVVGIYPNEERKTPINQCVQRLNDQIDSSSKIVGIGECGYDITEWAKQRPLYEQRELFERQVELAIQKDLPVVIHNRNGDTHVLKSLKKFTNFKGTAGNTLVGVAHCFTQDWGFAKQLLDLGFYISFSAVITYPSGKSLIETAQKIPIDRILVETDAPYLSPQGMRNQVNEPKYVRITAKTLADIRGIGFDELCNATFENSCRLFKKMAAQNKNDR